MVIHFLSLGWLCAKQGSSGIDQILSLFVQLLRNQEIFLLRADRGTDALHIFVTEKLQNPHSLPVQCFHRAKQRGLLIQSLTAIRAKCRGDAQGLALNKRVGSGVPGGVTSCFEGCPQAAGGERGGVRLALDQLFAGEIHDDAAVRCRRNKAIVLFCGDAGQRLEPVGIMGGTVSNGPVLHSGGNGIGYGCIQLGTLIDGLAQRLIDIRAQICLHDTVIKNQAAKIIRNSTHKIYTPFQNLADPEENVKERERDKEKSIVKGNGSSGPPGYKKRQRRLRA